MPRVRHQPRGFTLIEIGAVLALMVVVMAMALPSIRSVTGVQARTEVAKLAANIRATRGHAAAAGQTCRMVFLFGAGGVSEGDAAYSVECADGATSLAREHVRNGAMDEDESDPEHMTPAEKARAEIMARTRFTAAPFLPAQRLEGVALGSVWTAHQPEKYTRGKANLYFFPSGQTETANVQLHAGDDWYSLHVSPLSGRVKILTGRADLPDQREEQD